MEPQLQQAILGIIRRQKEAVDHFWKSERKAAKDLGWTQPRLNRHLKTASVEDFNDATLANVRLLSADLLRFKPISATWLDEGEGEMLLPGQGDGSAGDPPRKRRAKRKTPPVSGILDRITAGLASHDARAVEVVPFGHGAGNGVINDGPGDLAVLPETMLRQLAGGRTPGNVIVSFVRGDSMLPYLIAGTPILIEEMRDFVEGGRYAIWYGSRGEDEIKRVERIGEKRIRISSDNKTFPPRVYEHLEEDWYVEVATGHREQIRVRGMIFFPPDMAAAVVGQISEFSGNLINQIMNR